MKHGRHRIFCRIPYIQGESYPQLCLDGPARKGGVREPVTE